VVVVAACDGDMWTAAGAGAGRRLSELRASAAVLGVARVEHLGYADSGAGPVLYDDPPGRQRFARADLAEAAERLAGLIRQERADVLLSYDREGGYRHPDHIKVHQVGARAAQLVESVRVLEATVPRELVTMAFRPATMLRLITRYDPGELHAGFTPRAAITHRIDVRRYAAQKQAALAAHRSQVRSRGRAARLMRLLVRLPTPVFAMLLGREWFAEPGRAPENVRSDILDPA